MQKKIASKISAGVLSAVLVLQGMFPTVAVMADEISETGSSETVIEETIAETSESEEAKVSETSETTAAIALQEQNTRSISLMSSVMFPHRN